jgi:hypothetical protein
MGREAEQPAAPERRVRQLEIRDLRLPERIAEPILFLREIIVHDTGTMHGDQHGFSAPKIFCLAFGTGDMHGQSIDPRSDEKAVAVR